jgi:hypothetical protein
VTLPRATEQTLGLLAEVRASRSLVGGARRLVRPESPHRASLGTAFIGIGASLVCAISAIYGFSIFVSHWHEYPNPIPALAAWVVLILVLATAFVTASVVGDRLPDWMFSTFLALLALVVVLDVVAVWQLHDFGGFATASLTAGTALLLVLTLRRPMEILVAVSAIGIGLLIVEIVNTDLNPDTVAPQLSALAFAVLPVVIGVVIVRGFRSMVQVELDRVLVQSTVSAPRFAVGMLASEELARLDLAAEELLDSVATGRIALPLRPKTASVAASLATELRLHLIEGRRETWLYHAITESELLGRSVTLTDKSSLAGLLDANQRDGLLAAVWLLVNDHAKKTAVRTVQVDVGPIAASTPAVPSRKLRVPIVITTTGVPRNRVDPSTWNAIRRVGRYSDSSQNASLRVEIECFVDNPADV